MFYAVGSTRAAHGARAPRPRCCRRGGGVLARDAVDNRGRRTRLPERSSRTLGAPHLAGVAGKHRVARAIGPRSRVQHVARTGARARRRVLQQRHRAARDRAPAPTGRLRSARNRPHVSARCGTSGARLDQRQPGVERGRSAYCARSPRQQAPRVADGAARDRAGRREGRGRQPCLRRQARAVDARADRRARRPLRVSDRSRPPPTTFRASCGT